MTRIHVMQLCFSSGRRSSAFVRIVDDALLAVFSARRAMPGGLRSLYDVLRMRCIVPHVARGRIRPTIC